MESPFTGITFCKSFYEAGKSFFIGLRSRRYQKWSHQRLLLQEQDFQQDRLFAAAGSARDSSR